MINNQIYHDNRKVYSPRNYYPGMQTKNKMEVNLYFSFLRTLF